jgi:hypothetical protein
MAREKFAQLLYSRLLGHILAYSHVHVGVNQGCPSEQCSLLTPSSEELYAMTGALLAPHRSL